MQQDYHSLTGQQLKLGQVIKGRKRTGRKIYKLGALPELMQFYIPYNYSYFPLLFHCIQLILPLLDGFDYSVFKRVQSPNLSKTSTGCDWRLSVEAQMNSISQLIQHTSMQLKDFYETRLQRTVLYQVVNRMYARLRPTCQHWQQRSPSRARSQMHSVRSSLAHDVVNTAKRAQKTRQPIHICRACTCIPLVSRQRSISNHCTCFAVQPFSLKLLLARLCSQARTPPGNNCL